jgi:hypothetical protein
MAATPHQFFTSLAELTKKRITEMNKLHTFINTMRNGVKTAISKAAARRTLLLAIAVICTVSPALAADGIAGKLTEIGANFKGYVEPVRNIVYALAAICAVIGAFTIYFKMTNGEQDVKKTIMLTVGGCAGLVALATALPAMFD